MTDEISSDDINIKTQEDFDNLKKKGIHHFVFKANVPLNDYKEFYDWTLSCQAKEPEGFNDYRWGKMLHDHFFVKNFKHLLIELNDNYKDLLFRVEDIEEKLNKIMELIENG